MLSVHFIDLDNYYREWDLDQLPWDAASPIDPADEHPDTLDEKLINAISSRALIEPIDYQPKARPAATTFLYLYMKLTLGEERYAHLFRNNDGTGDITTPDRRLTLPRARRCRSGLVWGLLLRFPPARRRRFCFCIGASLFRHSPGHPSSQHLARVNPPIPTFHIKGVELFLRR